MRSLHELASRHRSLLARSVLVVFLLLAVLWQWDIAKDPRTASSNASSPDITDMRLYAEISDGVAAGEGYYASATDSHRLREYPTSPWFTVRLPTLAYLTAWFGPTAMGTLARILVVAGMVAWWVAFHRAGAKAAEVLFAGVAALSGGLIAFYMDAHMHELWSGLFVSLAFACYRPGKPAAAIAFALVACALREFAILVIGTGFLVALFERRKDEAVKWFAAGLLVAAFYAVHAWLVIGARLEGDVVSPGWSGMIGPMQTVYWIAATSVFRMPGLPVGGTVALMAMAGWFAAGRRTWIVLPVLVGWFFAMAVFSRPENYYWAQFFLPWLPIGLILFPRLCAMALGRSGLDGHGDSGAES